MTQNSEYITILRRTLATRLERNPRYSIRAFARSMRFSDGALSQILSGKRVPAYRSARRILDALQLPPSDEKRFLLSLAKIQRARSLKRLHAGGETRRLESSFQVASDNHELEEDRFRVMADWYHAAILEITQVEGFTASPSWIAARLGVTATEATLAIERLMRLGLLQLDPATGRLAKTYAELKTADRKATSPALRKHQKQLLEKALDSLERDPIEERSMTGTTVAIDAALIPEAKLLIDRFHHELCELLERGERNRVYQLQVSLFPLQDKNQPARTAT
jgi:uncharacterized protein (TIGR02147 family)